MEKNVSSDRTIENERDLLKDLLGLKRNLLAQIALGERWRGRLKEADAVDGWYACLLLILAAALFVIGTRPLEPVFIAAAVCAAVPGVYFLHLSQDAKRNERMIRKARDELAELEREIEEIRRRIRQRSSEEKDDPPPDAA